MDGKLLLTFNTGSSTVKIGIFEFGPGILRRIGKGMLDFNNRPLTFHLTEGPDIFDVPLEAEAGDGLTEVLEETFEWLGEHFDLSSIDAVAHRVVHGGRDFTGPVKIDERTLADIEALTVLAPLHQPQIVRLINAIRDLRPDLPQTASFDTAFHRTMSETAQRFALPRGMFDEGIRRYGFHGLSYKYIAAELARRDPDLSKGRVVAAHLGSGASLCAMQNGESRDTSMSFTTLDGIPMATRCGAIDPGVLLHLLTERSMSRPAVEDLLYRRSGLLGVSGISADTRALIASDRAEAKEALDLYTFRAAGEIARQAVALEGLDGLVFTAGVGENQPAIRAMISGHLAFLGVTLDPAANAANAGVISAAGSRVKVMVIPTDEEQVIAEEALFLLGYPALPGPGASA
ncbi:acetate/propionate family kinase [Rhizobiaceae bacterium BDR2-2]|uniref:Acetate kinase n=1 Tax=Ectorhizobium quercum TaxID=2965071 RepID=A0AAE3N3L3_9HYPH|nr:acetate/propionate family kinase [Ectorhizobium quercum]MCX8999596.1 acetate/propionate family kinase [Ectorhizobium quercum]